tara:strand:- start:156 stop:554 length:399 start_codon:yes stop_codon:yes gene_type:complete
MRFLLLIGFINLSKSLKLVGNTYIAKFNIPVIFKKQNIRLHFIDKNNANLRLHGFINNEGNIMYNYNKDTKKFTYEPDDNIEKIMNKYLLCLYDICYNETLDIATVTIKSKILRIKQRINFNNIKKNLNLLH